MRVRIFIASFSFNGTLPVILIMAIFPQSARSVQYQRRVSRSVPDI